MLYKCLTPKKSTKIIGVILPVLVAVGFPVIMYSPLITKILPDLIFKRQLMMALIYVTYFLYCMLCFDNKRNEKILMYGIFALISFLHEMLVTVILVCSGKPQEMFTNPTVKTKIVMTILTIVIAAALYMGIILLRKKINRTMPWQMTTSAIFMLFSAMLLSMLVLNSHPSVYTPNNFLSNIIVGFMSFAAFVASMYFLFKFAGEQIRQKEKALYMQTIQKNSIEHYKSVQDNIKEVRKLKHDFKDNLSILKLLIDSGSQENINKASSLISTINNELDKINIAQYTQNEIVNAVLSAKIKEAQNNKIQVKTKLNIPKDLGNIDDYDLNILIMNLINNAIDACKKLSLCERTIEISIAVKANLFIVKVLNNYDTLNVDSKGKLRTTKKHEDEHGIGLGLINGIAKKYDGEDNIKTENGKFTHCVILNMK